MKIGCWTYRQSSTFDRVLASWRDSNGKRGLSDVGYVVRSILNRLTASLNAWQCPNQPNTFLLLLLVRLLLLLFFLCVRVSQELLKGRHKEKKDKRHKNRESRFSLDFSPAQNGAKQTNAHQPPPGGIWLCLSLVQEKYYYYFTTLTPKQYKVLHTHRRAKDKRGGHLKGRLKKDNCRGD